MKVSRHNPLAASMGACLERNDEAFWHKQLENIYFSQVFIPINSTFQKIEYVRHKGELGSKLIMKLRMSMQPS